MQSQSEADRRGLTKVIVDFRNVTKGSEFYKFCSSIEISKSVTSTGKVKGINLKIGITFKTS
jgi:hypothetical protein